MTNPTFVQAVLGSYSGGTNVNTVSATSGVAFTSGQYIVGTLVFYHSSAVLGNIQSISDGTNSYSVIDLVANADSWNLLTFGGFAASGKTTITVTFASSATYAYCQLGFHVVANVGGLGAHTTTWIQNASASPVSSGNVTATAGSYCYGTILQTFNTGTVTAGSGWTLENADSTDLTIFDEYQTGVSAGSVAATWGVVTGTNYDYAVAIATLTPSVCKGQLALVGVGCSIGWRASLIGAGALRFAKALKDNRVTTRRRLLLSRCMIGHNSGPKLDD